MRKLLIPIVIILSLIATIAPAQETPPIPRPRPDREGGQIVSSDGQQQDAEGSAALQAVDSAITDGPSNISNPGIPQPITLSAKISEEGAVIPNGLVWRIFDTQPGEDGELPLLEKSENAVSTFELTPGDYIVHVGYGRSQLTDTLRIDPGVSSHIFILDSGALRLTAAISGDIDIPEQELRFSIYSSELSGNSSSMLVAENVRPGEVVHLNSGIYSVVSYYGKKNAQVRADLRVEPGQITDATLYHRASRVNFKLVSLAGGEAIADVDWTLNTADGEQLLKEFGAFPTAVLAEGDYSVIARRGDNVYNRDFSVQAGPPQEIEVLTTVY